MSTNQEKVLSFLRDNGAPEDLVETVKDETAGFYTIAESDKYPLLPAEEQDAAAIAAAVSLATGREVTRVEFVSLSTLYPKPDGMSQAAYKHAFVGFRDSLRASRGDSLWYSLWYSLGASLWYSLWASLRASLGGSLGVSLRDSLWDSLGDSLFCYHAAALAGDREKVEQLTPLIRESRKSLPSFGFKKDEPTVLLHPAA
jgi:hypothetical protein